VSSGATEMAREAVAGDLAEVAGLWRSAMTEVAGVRGGRILGLEHHIAEPVEEALGRLARRADATVIVGTLDDVNVGAATVETSDLVDGTRIGRIGLLYVEPAARAVGVGEALIGELIAWCGAHNCAGIDALALPGMRETKNFFETAGFTARLLVMHRKGAD
jgi:GNAT superfamily N-acetyltransferase